MTNLVDAYQSNNVLEAEKIIKGGQNNAKTDFPQLSGPDLVCLLQRTNRP